MPGLPRLDPPRAGAQPQPEPGNGKVNDAHTHTHARAEDSTVAGGAARGAEELPLPLPFIIKWRLLSRVLPTENVQLSRILCCKQCSKNFPRRVICSHSPCLALPCLELRRVASSYVCWSSIMQPLGSCMSIIFGFKHFYCLHLGARLGQHFPPPRAAVLRFMAQTWT